MPVSNAHLNEMCQVWDGLSFEMLPNAEANKLEKQGLVQKTKNVQAKDLKHPEEFDKARQTYNTASALPPRMEPASDKKGRKKQYKTRELKAEA